MKTWHQILLDCFNGSKEQPPMLMPDLTIWYQWHKKRGSLPTEIVDKDLTEIADYLGCPAWLVKQPWKVKYDGINLVTEETEVERITRYETSKGTLSEKWILGPDGDWWREEYPVKTIKDFDALQLIAEAKTYVIQEDVSLFLAGESEVIALRLPMTPYSEALHSMLGWGEGLLLSMGKGEGSLQQILKVLENKRQQLINQLAIMPTQFYLTPDNLDGQYISPTLFKKYFAESYSSTVQTLHQTEKKVFVHLGGPGKHLLPLIADTGIDAVLGVSGPPQSNTTLGEAVKLAGPQMVLWGGIPQDFLTDIYSQDDLVKSLDEAISVAKNNPRIVIGIADHVPVGTEFSKLQYLAHRCNHMGQG